MPESLTDQQLADKVKRQQARFHVSMKLVGFLSAAAILVVVGMVIYKKNSMRPALETDYIDQVYGRDHKQIPKGELGSENARDGGKDYAARPDAVDMSSGNRDTVSSRSSSSNAPTTTPAAPAVVENLETQKEAIAQTVKDFYASKSIPELLPLVRDARRVRPLLEDYYARQSFEPHVLRSLGAITPVTEPGYRFVYVEAQLQDVPDPSYLVLEQLDVGFQVDWESAVRYSEMRWKDFLDHEAKGATLFRLLASKPEEEQKLTDSSGVKTLVKLRHPQEPGILYARFDQNDVEMKPLLEQLAACHWEEGREAPVTVRLAFPSAADSKAEITSVEGRGWLIIHRPVRLTSP